MVTRYLTSTIENLEAWHKLAKEDYFIRNNIPTRIIKNYTDRLTGTIEDTLVGLSVTGEITMDRIYDPEYHQDYPRTNLAYFAYDDSDVGNDKSFAYSTTQAWRDTNVGGAILNKSEAELRALEFIFGRDQE